MDREGFDFCFGLLLALLICLGVVGNTISFIIWSTGRRCKMSSGKLYLLVLAVSDTTALCLPVMELAVELLFGKKISNMNTFLCKLEFYGLHFGLIIPAWTITCFTVERTVAISMPLKWIKWRNRKRTIIVISIIFVSNILLNLPWAFGSEIIKQPAGTYIDLNNTDIGADNQDNASKTEMNKTSQIIKYCGLDQNSFIYMYEKQYHFWFLDFVLWFTIPFTTITVSNIIILVMLFRRDKTSRRQTFRHTSEEVGERNAMTKRAVALSTVHCICAGSFSIAALFPDFFVKAFVLKEGYYYYAGVTVAFVSFLNHAANFVLYSLFGTAFRRDCADILFKCYWFIFAKTPTENDGNFSLDETTIRTAESLANIEMPLRSISVIHRATC